MYRAQDVSDAVIEADDLPALVTVFLPLGGSVTASKSGTSYAGSGVTISLNDDRWVRSSGGNSLGSSSCLIVSDKVEDSFLDSYTVAYQESDEEGAETVNVTVNRTDLCRWASDPFTINESGRSIRLWFSDGVYPNPTFPRQTWLIENSFSSWVKSGTMDSPVGSYDSMGSLPSISAS
jgi:hypothetical protein